MSAAALMSLITALLWNLVLPAVGVASICLLLGYFIVGALSAKWRKRFADWHIGQAMKTFGVAGLIEDSNGRIELYPADYNQKIGAYSIGEQMWDATGRGAGGYNFYGGELFLACDQLGAVTSIGAAQTAAEAKHAVEADGGFSDGVEGDVSLETSGGRHTVNLSDVVYLAPFNVGPNFGKRIKDWAIASQSKFGSLGQAATVGGTLAGVVIGAALTYAFVDGGGGGGTVIEMGAPLVFAAVTAIRGSEEVLG